MSSQLSQKINRLYSSKTFVWIIIAVGIALRLIRYLHNPSLYFDESDIALDLISRPLSDIINPSPDYTQAYPFVWLILIKLSTQILGNSEHALRLLPLISGIIALFLFYRLAAYYIEPKAVPIALCLFAVLDPLVIQSSNLKPYSSDVTSTLLVYFLLIYLKSNKLNLPRIFLFGATGAFIVWFSNPSVFVLAGVGVCLGIFSLSKKEWSNVLKLTMIYLMWLLSFVANYFIYIKNLKSSFGLTMEGMLTMEKAFMPIPPRSISDIKWFIELFFDVFSNPLEMTLTGIATLAFLAGCVSMYSLDRKRLLLLCSPILLTFLAAALHEYPFKGRFIFFLLPVMLLLIAEGAEYVRSKTVEHSKIIWIMFIVLLLFHPISLSAYRIFRPFYYEDIKPVLNYVKNNWQKGDILYVHYFAQYPFEYYTKSYPDAYRFDESEYRIGIAPRGWYRHWRKQEVSKYYDSDVPIRQSSTEIFKIYTEDLDHLKGINRVWLLFTMGIPKDGINEEKFFVYHLETIGKQLSFFGKPGISSVYLYDLSGKATNERKKQGEL